MGLGRLGSTGVARGLLCGLVALAGACSGGRVEPRGAPVPAASARARASATAVAEAPAQRPPCEVAAEQRVRVPGLLAEGRLDRTVRVIRRADAMCPASAKESWA